MITSIINFAGYFLLGVGMFIIVLMMIIDESDFDIQDYLEERQRQKTARELARIQHQRETVGTIDDRNLFDDEDITVSEILGKDKSGNTDRETTTQPNRETNTETESETDAKKETGMN